MKTHLFLVVALASFACSQGEISDRLEGSSELEDTFEDETPSLPSNISGAFLTFEKAQIRCSQTNIDAFNHIVKCSLVEQIEIGLEIKPDHNGINEYLGELYIQTDRMDKARARLAVLKNCNCEEYIELKELIEKN